MLLEELRPQVVAISVAKDRLKSIEFAPRTDWKTIHVFDRKADGTPRSPYKVCARWYDVGGERSLFVFGRAAQTAFGTLAHKQKQRAGEKILTHYQDSR